jgi:hypothetical protein
MSISASPASGNIVPFVFHWSFSLGNEILLDLSKGFTKGAVTFRIASHIADEVRKPL